MKNDLIKSLPLLVMTVAMTLLSCSSSTKQQAIDEKARTVSTVKALGGSSNGFKLRPVREVKLENGLKILFIVDNSLPRVSLSMLTGVGSRQDGPGKEGLNFLTAHLLEDGTQTKNAMMLADEMAALGTEVSIDPSTDFTLIAMDSLVNSSDKLLEIFSDIVMNPAFMDQEVGRAKSQTIAQQQKKIDNPSAYTDDAFDDFLFSGHPYANDLAGTTASIKSIRKQDIIRHYLTYYRPNNSEIAVVGRFDRGFESKVAETFKRWSKKPLKEFKTPELKPIAGIEMKIVSKPGLGQAQIRMGQYGIRRNDPDFLKLRLASVALGGEFGSRMMQKVRDDLGLTYSIHSDFYARADRGPFTINTFTKNETVGKTIEETLKVFSEFAVNGMTEQELAASKEQVLGQFPRAIETADRLAYNILLLNYYGVPLSYLQDFYRNVSAISLAEVNEAVKKHLDSKSLRILVHADRAKLGNQLDAYKPVVVRAK